MNNKRYALIIGGELRNKGAQAMTFIAVSEIRRRFPWLQPVVVSNLDAHPPLVKRILGKRPRKDEDNLNFKIIPSIDLRLLNIKERRSGVNLKSGVKYILLRKQLLESIKIYEDAAFCINISGYSFGDKRGFKSSMRYLDYLEVLSMFEIPSYLLPQSFGDFEFSSPDEREMVEERSSELLPGIRIIFPRERESLTSLKRFVPNAKYCLSRDLVLQNKGIDLHSIFKQVPKPCNHLPKQGARTVGIVPNARNYEHADLVTIDALYEYIIEKLLADDFEIALIRHAFEDLEICRRLKAAFLDDKRVQVYGEDRYCFEYDELFGRCDFLIASRYHSIIHAYKGGVPCIALGWAAKYRELLELVGQQEFVHDVTAKDFDPVRVVESVDKVAANVDKLSEMIKSEVSRVQEENVFDVVENDLRFLIR